MKIKDTNDFKKAKSESAKAGAKGLLSAIFGVTAIFIGSKALFNGGAKMGSANCYDKVLDTLGDSEVDNQEPIDTTGSTKEEEES